MRLSIAALLTLLAGNALAGPLDDKTPSYYTNRYGQPKSSDLVNKISVLTNGRGALTLEGQFSQRTFREDKLHAEVIFLLPSLKIATVKLRLGHEWSESQLVAALQAYLGAWKPLSSKGIQKAWVASDGTQALLLLNTLHIQSKAITDQVAAELAASDAKRKEVPKF
jgi:hypothetical protein